MRKGGRIGLGCAGLAVAVLGGVGLFFVGSGLSSQESAWSTLQEHSFTEAEVDALLEDQRRVAQLGLFAERGRERDCGPVLNPYIGLDLGSEGPDEEPWWDAVDRDQLSRAWLETPADVPGGDFGLLEALVECDHWDPASGGAFGRRVGAPQIAPAMAIPGPDLRHLPSLARLRLAASLRRELPYLQALAEVHHLALLAMDGGTPMSQAVGNALLGIEAEAAEALAQDELIPTGSWPTLSRAKLDRLDRVNWGMVAVYSGLAPAGSIRRLEEAGVPLFARCGALGEGVKAASFVRVVLEQPAPLERDLRPWLAELEASLDRGDCGLPMARYYWENPEQLSRAPDESTAPGEDGPPLLWRIPWYRQGAVLLLLDLLGAPAVDMSRRIR